MKRLIISFLVCLPYLLSCGGSSSNPAHNFELDQTFNGSGFFTHNGAAGGDSSDRGQSVAVMQDGRIVVCGYSYNESGNRDMAVWVLNPDGTLDLSFNGKGWFTHHSAAGGNGDDAGESVAITSNGKIVVAGYSMGMDEMKGVVWCLNTDGTLSSSFNPQGTAPGWVILQEPEVETASTSYTAATCLAITDDGKAIVAGVYAYEEIVYGDYESIYYENLMVWCLSSDGSLDTSFNRTGIFIFDEKTEGRDSNWCYYPNSVAVDPNEKIVLAGNHMEPWSGATGGGIWKLSLDGRLDASFNDNGYLFPRIDGWYLSEFKSIAVTEDRIFITGGLRPRLPDEDSLTDCLGLLEFDQYGDLEATYEMNIPDGDQQDEFAVILTNDHQAVVGGSVRYEAEVSPPVLVDMAIWWQDLDKMNRLSSNGSGYFTQNFGTNNGYDRVQSLAVAPNGKIVAAGFSKNEKGDWDMAVWQLR